MTKEEKKFNSIITKSEEKFAVTKEDDFNYIIKTGNLYLHLTFNPEDLNIKVNGGELFEPFISHYPFKIITKILSRSWEPVIYARKLGQTELTYNDFTFRGGWEESVEFTANLYFSEWSTSDYDINTLILNDDEITLEIDNEVDVDYICDRATMRTLAEFPFAPSKIQLQALNESWYENIFKRWEGWCYKDGGEVVCGEYFYKEK